MCVLHRYNKVKIWTDTICIKELYLFTIFQGFFSFFFQKPLFSFKLNKGSQKKNYNILFLFITIKTLLLYLQRQNLIYFLQCPGNAVYCIAMHYISSLHTAQCALHSILSDAGQYTNKPVQREQKRQNKVICQFTVLHTVLQLKSCDPQRSKNPIAVLLQFFNAVVHT